MADELSTKLGTGYALQLTYVWEEVLRYTSYTGMLCKANYINLEVDKLEGQTMRTVTSFAAPSEPVNHLAVEEEILSEILVIDLERETWWGRSPEPFTSTLRARIRSSVQSKVPVTRQMFGTDEHFMHQNRYRYCVEDGRLHNHPIPTSKVNFTAAATTSTSGSSSAIGHVFDWSGFETRERRERGAGGGDRVFVQLALRRLGYGSPIHAHAVFELGPIPSPPRISRTHAHVRTRVVLIRSTRRNEMERRADAARTLVKGIRLKSCLLISFHFPARQEGALEIPRNYAQSQTDSIRDVASAPVSAPAPSRARDVTAAHHLESFALPTAELERLTVVPPLSLPSATSGVGSSGFASVTGPVSGSGTSSSAAPSSTGATSRPGRGSVALGAGKFVGSWACTVESTVPL
ncbi:hypothetical protein C8R45DRAFT_937635 [Mycena sanguinolenta]|nr:hypothetical protein C8R45DRAFT_937635 [Mycena sanguinolenta]